MKSLTLTSDTYLIYSIIINLTPFVTLWSNFVDEIGNMKKEGKWGSVTNIITEKCTLLATGTGFNRNPHATKFKIQNQKCTENFNIVWNLFCSLSILKFEDIKFKFHLPLFVELNHACCEVKRGSMINAAAIGIEYPTFWKGSDIFREALVEHLKVPFSSHHDAYLPISSCLPYLRQCRGIQHGKAINPSISENVREHLRYLITTNIWAIQ